MSSLYTEIILDYYKNPRNRGELSNPDIRSKDFNPLCGDEVEMQLKLDGDGKISAVRFNGKGCAISQASASMLTELVQGKSLEDVRSLSKEDIFQLLGGPVSVVRVKCALLPLKVLKTGVYSHLGRVAEAKDELSQL